MYLDTCIELRPGIPDKFNKHFDEVIQWSLAPTT